MVRRSHVVPGSIACCPWWTLGGGALVAAAAFTLSRGPARHVAGAELVERADLGVEVFTAEPEDDELPPDDEGPRVDPPTPLGTPPRSASDSAHDGAAPAAPRARTDVYTPGFPESVSASRPVGEASHGEPAQMPDAR